MMMRINNCSAKVSVIIPVYNGEKYISDAIESIEDQTYKNIEIIVIDDGSTDNTYNILKKYNNIKYVYQTNSGPAAARNHGIEISKGDFIAFLDCDDLYEKNKIEKQVIELISNREIDIVYNDVKMVDNNLDIIDILKPECVIEDRKNFLAMLLFRQLIPLPPSIMVRKRCFAEGIKYNQNYINAEDYDFIIKLAERYRFKYINEQLYIYRRHQENLTNNHKMQVRNEKNIIKSLGINYIKATIEQSNYSKNEKILLLSKIYLKIGERELAKQLLYKLVREKQEPYAYFYLGNCYYYDGEYDKSVLCYENAIKINQYIAEVYNNLGCALLKNGDDKGAEMFLKSLKIRKNYFDASYNYNQYCKLGVEFKITEIELRKVLMRYT